jgi:energy-coupling factor transport system permease protein
MAGEFDLYVRRHSWLHHLDPRVKLLFVLDCSLVLLLWPAVGPALAVILLSIFLMWQAQVPSGQILNIWRMMGPVTLTVFVLTALFSGGTARPWFQVGPLAVTPDAVHLGASLALRLLGLATVVFLWLFTTDQATMVRGFVALRMPYEWGLVLALALRYLPVFAGLFAQVREAQQARGLDLTQQRFWQRLRAYQPILVAMVISVLRQSESLGWALQSRALGAHGTRRTVFRPLHLRRLEVVALLGLAGLGLLAVALRVL